MPNLMETANCHVALGGDKGNLVPKYGVTVAEIMVLRLIHGDDSVTDIEPSGTVDVADRDEVDRLALVFFRPAHVISPVKTLYPGANPRVDRVFAETRIDEQFYKATKRASPAATITGVLADKDAEIEALKAQLAAAQTAAFAEAAGKPRARKTQVADPLAPSAPPADTGTSLLD